MNGHGGLGWEGGIGPGALFSFLRPRPRPPGRRRTKVPATLERTADHADRGPFIDGGGSRAQEIRHLGNPGLDNSPLNGAIIAGGVEPSADCEFGFLDMHDQSCSRSAGWLNAIQGALIYLPVEPAPV